MYTLRVLLISKREREKKKTKQRHRHKVKKGNLKNPMEIKNASFENDVKKLHNIHNITELALNDGSNLLGVLMSSSSTNEP